MCIYLYKEGGEYFLGSELGATLPITSLGFLTMKDSMSDFIESVKYAIGCFELPSGNNSINEYIKSIDWRVEFENSNDGEKVEGEESYVKNIDNLTNDILSITSLRIGFDVRPSKAINDKPSPLSDDIANHIVCKMKYKYPNIDRYGSGVGVVDIIECNSGIPPMEITKIQSKLIKKVGKCKLSLKNKGV